MPLKIIRQDITKIKCDVIVNPTDGKYAHGGGVDKAIHNAAGEELYRACLDVGYLSVGQAAITPAFSLPCKYVIHTVGPDWNGGGMGEEAQLRSCYRNALLLAREKNLHSIAFPLISSGTFGFPKEQVLKIALDEIGGFLFENEMLVYVVVFDKESYTISEKLFYDITSFVDSVYEDKRRVQRELLLCDFECSTVMPSSQRKCKKTLEEMLGDMDKGFAETLFCFIDGKGMSDVECYKRANVDKKTFSKIKCNKEYKPSKKTVVSFAIALRLDIEETQRLLNTVGMSLSRSNKFDVIIEYFITTGNYNNIFDVNETLYKFDQPTLGV